MEGQQIMKIALLAWGSLVRFPKNLRICEKWHNDGPFLPVEFARISTGERLTLVLHPKVKKVQVLWTVMQVNNLNEATEELRIRECTSNNHIGFLNVHSGEKRSNIIDIQNHTHTWIEEKEIDAVIWTDLPSNFEKVKRQPLNIENIISFLNSLHNQEILLAEQYVRTTPVQIKTEFRAHIEKQLDWTPVEESQG